MTTSPEQLVEALRASLMEVENLRQQNDELTAALSEPVAIVGMACRYPGGVRSPEDLWRLVVDEVDAISAFPGDRGWDLDGLFDPDPENVGTSYTQEGGFVQGAVNFDAEFFRISPREALAMEPQQRVLLEAAWEAIERAGIDAATLKGSRTGVFIGAGAPGYGTDLAEIPEEAQGYTLTGIASSVISGRVSYSLGLEGPAVTVDTACSSSLVALHQAVQALRQGECSLALAGGVTIMSSPGVFQEFSRQRGLSPDGRCKAFASAADGTGWSEGVGVLLVERLSDARRNGHRVLAVVRGSAVNQDGASNGLTAPNGPSQQRVIRQALANARLTVDQVDAVEAHGTGTRLGDPIEAQALLATYGRRTATDRPLRLGSIKSNLGHAQAASGVVGVIKMVMALHHGLLPKTLHVDEPTPHVDWESGAVRLLTEAEPWPETGEARRAAVSSFGVSGTNAHIILEQGEAHETAEPPPVPPTATTDVVPWIVSGRGPGGLARVAEQLAAFVDRADSTGPREIAAALDRHRAVLDQRAVVVGASRTELLAGLRALAAEEPAPQLVVGEGSAAAQPVFVFPGQGAQWSGMALELADAFPTFDAALTECGTALAPFVDWDLRQELAGDLARVDVVQPASWAVMVSLARLWESFGVTPAAVVGHSQGEIAAAVVADALSIEDGARVVALRSKVIAEGLAGRGGMASVALPAATVQQRLDADGHAELLAVAAVNGPSATVVSGEPAALDALIAAYEAEEVRVRRIAVDYASHSPHVESIRDELLRVLAPVAPRSARVPFYSTVDGGLIDAAALDADYWVRNLRETVEFAPVVSELIGEGFNSFVECSAHPVLAVGVADAGAEAVVGSLRRGEGGAARFVTSLAEAFVGGVRIDWTPLLGTPATGDLRGQLPTYPFQATRYWLESAAPKDTGGETDETKARFWAAVENEDLPALADTLDLEPDQLREVLPALAAWRRRADEDFVIDSWRYQTAWRPVTEPARTTLAGTWLLAVSATGGEQPWLAEAETALIEHGARVARLSIDPTADRVSLATTLAAESAAVPDLTGVLSLLPLDETPHPEYPSTARGFAATLTLLQALADTGVEAPLWCATSGAVSTGVSDPLTSPTQAQTWGLGRVAAEESQDRWGGLVDLPATPEPRSRARLAAVLAGLDHEDQLAVRRSGVYAHRLVRGAWGEGRAPRPWRPEGTALVTGGTGALGGHVARWLAREGAPHLLLLSSRGPDAPGAAQLAAELTASGSRVTVVACDIADRDALAAVIADIPAELPLRTVVHTAAVLDDGVIDSLTPAQLERVERVKVRGAAHLDELTAELDVSTFVLFSSFAGLFGVAGQGNYAPGNAYLDALARARRARGLPATSVAWGHWAGGGIASGDAEEHLRRRGGAEMDPETALRAFRKVLDHDETAVALAHIEWGGQAAGAPTVDSRPRPYLGELAEVRQLLAAAEQRPATAPGAPGESGALPDRLAQLPRGERERAVLDLVTGQIAAVLGHGSPEAVDAGRPFRELGFDSLTSVELRNRLGVDTGLKLPATLVFDHPTPQALAAHLRGLVLEGIEGLDDGDDQPALATAPAQAAATDDDPVVIVGMACRLPGGVDDPDALWQLIVDERDAVGGLPTDRGWNVDGLIEAGVDVPGMRYVRQGGFLRDAASFDASFFGIPDHEALAMDPQHRLLLEMSWEAVERAGVAPGSLRGEPVGVFVGSFSQGYWTGLQEVPDESRPHLNGGVSPALAAGRIAYTLGLEGPVLTLDTGCSSSSVALHLACQAVRQGDCGMALVGGASVLANPAVSPGMGVGAAEDGRCKSYAEDADGTGWGEGAGVLVVERLSTARERGHRVLAVIRGTAINHNGASNGLGAPNGPSQQRMLRQALANAGLGPHEIDVVEGHGTGTELGDAIEAQALMSVYGAGRDADRPLWLGTVKSNIAHPQAASGVIGVIKTVLCMHHGVLPRLLHSDEPSSRVEWSEGGVRLLTKTIPWPATGRPRRAGVSSFGASGTKVHVILEQPEETEELTASHADGRLLPLPLTARDETALRQQAARLRARLLAAPDTALADTAWTQAVGRTPFAHRAVLLTDDRAELLDGLAAIADGGDHPAVLTGVAPRGERAAAVLCVGAGAVPVDIAALYAQHRPFADALDAICAQLDPKLPTSVLDTLLSPGTPDAGAPDSGSPPGLAASFAVEYALFRLLREWEVPVASVGGRGPGAVVAALAAEALDPADGVTLLLTLADGRGVTASTLAGLDWRAPLAPVTHPVTGDPVDPAELRSAAYWDAAWSAPEPIAPPTTAHAGVPLLLGGTASADERAHAAPVAGPHPDRALLTALARLHTAGVPLDWRRVFADVPAGAVDLPTYPFQRERYWLHTSLAGLPDTVVAAG
ncbi:type I polyketide synthase [Streptomyces sp. PT12]|uniref:type I polyketide synthase n=1 Tax=Streptomyces sp. PT12 TaxID=1510197 RepID=UPI000DE1CB3C|nr:type I polyketide synthase [Streptomyces sp. PT12]RBM23856.1 6-deoxyerythronolide-B synthase [Streptomyces sp. PT12]